MRIGDVAQNQKERVSGYELQTVNGELVCVTLWEDIPIVAQYLPTAQVATTTAAIAVTAASSALLAKPLADLLLKVFKPVIKSNYKGLQNQGEEGKDRVPKGAPRSSARTLTGDSDFAEDEGREIE